MPVIIIPAYKPEKMLLTVVERLLLCDCQVIVVDDGSGEEYREIFDETEAFCIVLRHSENRGKGAAIKTALSFIRNEMRGGGLIGIMDCDGQHLPEDMLELLAFAGAHREALALGVRKVGTDMPLKFRLGNQITREVFRMISGVKVSDTQTGMRALDSKLIPRLLSVKGDRYEYEMNQLMACARAGIPIVEMPISTIYRDEKNSNSHFHKVRDSIRIYKDILKFTAFSFSSFLLDYLLFSLLMLFLPHRAGYLLLANLTARGVSAFYNYSMNCRFVFHRDREINTAAGYFALAGFIFLLNNLLLEAFVQGAHLSVYLAKLLTECSLFVISWLIQKCIIFGKKAF